MKSASTENSLTSRLKANAIEWLENNRGLVILIFCLPASFLFDLFIKIRIWIHRKFSKNSNHSTRVSQIQQNVLEWNRLPENQKKLLCTARPNWLSLSTTFFNKEACHKIPIDLHEILKLDEENLSITVEPNVTVNEICQYLIPLGYTLAVTLEVGDATLGGLAFGVGMTTYSHKVGLYQETILEYEIITAKGNHIFVTKDNQHSDLFYCLPWSHGTLGFLVGLKLQIIKIKPFIHMKYIACKTQDEYCDKMMEYSGANRSNEKVADYIEATIFDKERAVIMLGNFVDLDSTTKLLKVNDVCQWWKPWFYKHVETFLDDGGEELIPLQSYLLRHNRAIFWVLESMIPFGNHPIFRLLFGWLCPPKPAFLKFTTTQTIREMTFAKQVFQDIVMPLKTLKQQVNTSIQLFDTFPLLAYPCRIYDHQRGLQGQLRPPSSDLLVPDTNYAIFNDLGIYGTPGPVKRHENYNPTYAMRAMEKFTRDVGGYSFLYADIFMTEDEFNQMFDLTLYNQVRIKYSCDGAFPRLFDKVKPEIDVISIGESYGQKKID